MKKNHHFARLVIILLFFSILLLVLIWRMIDLMVLDRKFLQGQGNARSIRTLDIPAYRGMITDRNGAPLAVSTSVKSVWINPQEFSPDSHQLKQLKHLLNINPQILMDKVKQLSSREFIYLTRQIPPTLTKKISNLNIAGVNFQHEFKRYYPEGESVAHVIGFTNVDDQGLEGIELAYQDWLMGIMGKKRVLKDRIGRIIEELDVIKEPRPGHDLPLSIDRRLQYLAYNELTKTVNEFAAKSGSVIVLDSQSGEILAMVNVPSYNPNSRSRYDQDRYRNRAATDTFEPGSVIKPFSIASALESGLFTPDTIIDTNPSWIMVHGHPVRDGRNYGVLDVTGILQHSSNVGVTKLVLASPPENLLNLFSACGFGQRTETAFPGESSGSMVRARDANPFVHATLAFGYGISVTALQLAKAYLVFANEGKLMPVSLLHNVNSSPAIQVIKKKTAQQVLTMMEAVVSKYGTGRNARIAGYRVAGKTGTSRIAGKNGYEANRHIASFAGIAPVSNPRFVVVVVIHEPTHRNYYGSSVAAPLFAKVMKAALHLYDIQPDEQ
ncbi:penicillin-binding protein 2 [Legionella israelensis]|uniref:peptidoglycan D,D-transpeptidase FtsI family protein n=1 Tax=Legionella israelensis TaxID=454 RepID=UPI00117D3A1A|nr:penicillin-binding protein 2 [Legionella israelensis]QDP72979.1 penicillin-binding protein 2 [Legionella israelensis]